MSRAEFHAARKAYIYELSQAGKTLREITFMVDMVDQLQVKLILMEVEEEVRVARHKSKLPEPVQPVVATTTSATRRDDKVDKQPTVAPSKRSQTSGDGPTRSVNSPGSIRQKQMADKRLVSDRTPPPDYRGR